MPSQVQLLFVQTQMSTHIDCIVSGFIKIRQILTTHYAGQRYSCGINFKTKTKQKQKEARSLA